MQDDSALVACAFAFWSLHSATSVRLAQTRPAAQMPRQASRRSTVEAVEGAPRLMSVGFGKSMEPTGAGLSASGADARDLQPSWKWLLPSAAFSERRPMGSLCRTPDSHGRVFRPRTPSALVSSVVMSGLSRRLAWFGKRDDIPGIQSNTRN
jgi:hypothetical protein